MRDQMSNPVTSENLYDSPLWRAKLEWMKENNPEQVRQLFRQGKLKGVLDQSTARLMDRVQHLQNNGWTPEEAQQPRVPDRSEGRKLERGGQPAAAIERGGTDRTFERLAPQSAPQREVAPLSEADQNHVIEPGDEMGGSGGAKTKARQNIEAIKLLKRLEAENRNPTQRGEEDSRQVCGLGRHPAGIRRHEQAVGERCRRTGRTADG
jgi:hypothetical protein